MSVRARSSSTPGHEPIPPIPKLAAGDLSGARRDCRKSLEKDPARRHATAKELADDLKRYAESGVGPAVAASGTSLPGQPAPVSCSQAPIPVVPRNWWRTAGIWAGLAILTAILSVVGYIGYGHWASAAATKRTETQEARARRR